MRDYSVIGKSVPRVDARVKATGGAIYTDDISLPGMLVGKLLRSPLAHARILNVDTSRAVRLPGVKAVITGTDPPCGKYTNWRVHPELADASALAADKVRFLGEEVAGVAAADEETALEALSRIKVDYEELPGVFTLDEAMADGAPLVHDEYAGNINPRVNRRLAFGDVEEGFRQSDHIREDEFNTQTVIHCYLEPHAALASYEPPGRLTLWTTTGVPYYLRWDIAAVLGLREGDVRIIKPYVGGNFGGRNVPYSLDFCSALLAMRAGKPVKITYDRQEEFTAGMRRHAARIRLKTGVKRDGTLVAKQVTTHLDGGAYNGFGPTTTYLSGLFHTLVYRFPHYRYDGYRVYTNKPTCIGMRGFCGPQAHFAFESQMDMLAEDLGIDPLDIRLKNAMQAGYQIPGIATVSSSGLTECLEKLAESIGWRERARRREAGKGIGIACFSHFSGASFNFFNTSFAFSTAEVRAYPDGTVTLLTLAPEVGQGSDTVLSQILAEELGLRMADIALLGTDTAIDPVDLGAYSSRITMMAGNAVISAARDLKRQLFAAAAARLETGVIHELEAREGCIRVRGNPGRSLPFAEAVLAAMRAQEGLAVIGRGTYTPRGKGFASPAFSFGAVAAEVDVDRQTGQVSVGRVTVAHDCGVNINPLAVEGQVAGAVQMGLGYALSENLVQEKGRVRNGSFAGYKMPAAVDMPPIVSISVETSDPEGPYGAKEVGEGSTNPVAPAIANAVYNAVGYRARSLPVTPEQVLEAARREAGGAGES